MSSDYLLSVLPNILELQGKSSHNDGSGSHDYEKIAS